MLKGEEKMVLELKDVTKRFGNFTAVDQLSFTIPEQEMFGFPRGEWGRENNDISNDFGLLNPSNGSITWDGKPINYSTSPIIGYLPEERGLYPKLKVRDQMVYLARLRGMPKKEVLKELDYWLERFKVPEYAEKKVEELSKGNQQKIQFIAAMIHKPKLLFLDEPFSGLDPVNVELLKEAVIGFKRKWYNHCFFKPPDGACRGNV